MRLFKVLAAVMVLLASGTASAGKVAVLGLEQALLSTKAAAEFREEQKKKYAPLEQQAIQLQQQAKEAQEKLVKSEGLVSEAEMSSLKADFQKRAAAFQSLAGQLQQKRQQDQQAFLGQMKPKIDEVLLQLVKAQSIDVIIPKNATLFSSPAVDITPDVIKLLNK